MERGAQAAARQRVAPSVRPTAIGCWRGAPGRLRLIAASAALVMALVTVAVAVDASPEPPAARWFGTIEARGEGKAERLLRAAALGLGAEVRRVEADRDGMLRALRDQLDALTAQQALLLDRLRSNERPETLQPGPTSGHGAKLAGRQTAMVPLVAKIAAIKSGVPSLEEEVRGLRLVAAALLLREGAQSARPFEPALDRFALVAAAVTSTDLEGNGASVTERIEALRPYAQAGVVSTRDLRRSFAALAEMVDRAAGQSWWDQALVMVGMRADPLRPLQDARTALTADDLQGAVTALAALQGEAALVSEGWLQLAEARLATDAMVGELYRMALAVGVESLGADAPVASSDKITPAPRRLPAAGPWRAAQTTPEVGLSAR